jgi:hypothetical protein
MMAVSYRRAPGPPPASALRAPAPLKQARTCYDHLAGRLGVAITDAMLTAGLIEPAPAPAPAPAPVPAPVPASVFGLTEAGICWFRDVLQVAPESLFATQRPAARSCLDWTERRPHLAGAAGAALARASFSRGWIERSGSTRAIKVTPAGHEALRRLFAIEFLAKT